MTPIVMATTSSGSKASYRALRRSQKYHLRSHLIVDHHLVELAEYGSKKCFWFWSQTGRQAVFESTCLCQMTLLRTLQTEHRSVSPRHLPAIRCGTFVELQKWLQHLQPNIALHEPQHQNYNKELPSTRIYGQSPHRNSETQSSVIVTLFCIRDTSAHSNSGFMRPVEHLAPCSCVHRLKITCNCPVVKRSASGIPTFNY